MAKTTVIDIPVQFATVSIGDLTARIGIKIERSNLALGKADKIFVNRRLTCKVQLGGAEDQSGQKKLGPWDHEVDGVADVKQLGVKVDTLTTGLTFSKSEIEITELAEFSKGTGRLVVHSTDEIPDQSDEEEEDEEE